MITKGEIETVKRTLKKVNSLNDLNKDNSDKSSEVIFFLKKLKFLIKFCQVGLFRKNKQFRIK